MIIYDYLKNRNPDATEADIELLVTDFCINQRKKCDLFYKFKYKIVLSDENQVLKEKIEDVLKNAVRSEIQEILRELDTDDLAVLWMIVAPDVREILNVNITHRLQDLVKISGFLIVKAGKITQQRINQVLQLVNSNIKSEEVTIAELGERFRKYEAEPYHYTNGNEIMLKETLFFDNVLFDKHDKESLQLTKATIIRPFNEADYDAYDTDPIYYQSRAIDKVFETIQEGKKDEAIELLFKYSSRGKGNCAMMVSGMTLDVNTTPQFMSFICREVDGKRMIYKRINNLEYYPFVPTEKIEDLLYEPFYIKKRKEKLKGLEMSSVDEFKLFLGGRRNA